MEKKQDSVNNPNPFNELLTQYNLGLINPSEFVARWEAELNAVNLTFSSDIRKDIEHARGEFERRMVNIAADISGVQEWLTGLKL